MLRRRRAWRRPAADKVRYPARQECRCSGLLWRREQDGVGLLHVNMHGPLASRAKGRPDSAPRSPRSFCSRIDHIQAQFRLKYRLESRASPNSSPARPFRAADGWARPPRPAKDSLTFSRWITSSNCSAYLCEFPDVAISMARAGCSPLFTFSESAPGSPRVPDMLASATPGEAPPGLAI